MWIENTNKYKTKPNESFTIFELCVKTISTLRLHITQIDFWQMHLLAYSSKYKIFHLQIVGRTNSISNVSLLIYDSLIYYWHRTDPQIHQNRILNEMHINQIRCRKVKFKIELSQICILLSCLCYFNAIETEFGEEQFFFQYL